MQIQYYQSAWGDIRNSEGWFGKLCLLALVGLIPVFGQIVVGGYLYGWAREMAWGVHEPLPAKIFGNEDGKLYRRGWFVLVVVFVFSLIPSIITGIGSSLQQISLYSFIDAGSDVAMNTSIAFGSLLYFVGLVLALLVSILAWIGSMRVSIYDRLSTGFQFGVIWKMFRRDTGGIMRIFGMNLLVGLILGIILSILFTVLFVIVVLAGIGGLMSAGYSPESWQYMSDAQAMRFIVQFIASAGVVGMLCMLVGVYACSLGSVFVDMLVARALGYWTWQFDVPNWRGPSDPLPFVQVMPEPMTQPYQQPVAQQPVGTAQPQGQQFDVQQPTVAAWPPARPEEPTVDQEPTSDQPAVGWQAEAQETTAWESTVQEPESAPVVATPPSNDLASTGSLQEETQEDVSTPRPSSEDWDSQSKL